MMDPIAFPPQIREFFQRHPNELADTDEIELTNIFKENVSAKDDFIAWTREHQGVVERTPRLYKALELAIENPDGFGEVLEPWSGMVKVGNSINSLYHWVKDDGSYALINDLLKIGQKEEYRVTHIEQDFDFPEKYVSTALELHEAGVINKNALKYLLSIKDPDGCASVFYAEGLKLAIPLLEKLESKDLVTILSIKDKYGELLEDRKIFELVVPLFEKLEPKDLISILSIQNKYGTPLLSDERKFKLAIPLLEKLDVKDLATVLSIRNASGQGILETGVINELAASLLEKLNLYTRSKLAMPLLEGEDLKELVTLLSFKKNARDALIHDAEIFKLAIPHLEKMDYKDLVTLLLLENRDYEHPLDNKEIFQLAIPFFEKLDFEDLVSLFSTQNNKFHSPLYNPEIFELAIPFFEKMGPKVLATILLIKNDYGQTPLHIRSVFELATPLLEKMPPQDFATLFSFQEAAVPLLEKLEPKDRVTLLAFRTHGGGRVSFKQLLESVISIVEKLPLNDRVAFLSLQDDKGQTFLRTPAMLLRLFSGLPLDNLKQLFSIQDRKGNTLLHMPEMFSEAIPLLEKMDPDDRIALLSIKNQNGNLAIQNDEIIKLAVSIFEKLEPGDSVAFLSIQDAKGQTLLHMPHLYNEVSLLAVVLPTDSLSQLFSMQDNEGNTPLHNPLIFNKVRYLLGIIKPEVFQIRNKVGLTADEWRKIQVSMNWLVKDKIATDLKALSEEEYKDKLQQLKQNLDTLWDSFVFGDEEGNVPQEYLRLNIPDAKADYTPQEIKAALDVMVDKMIGRTPWLGTPRKEDTEGLHLFYTQMLNNFEQIVSLFEKEEGPEKKAGPLIGIAKVELEGRCAAAYQSEIEQAKMLLDSDSEGFGLEGNFDKLARASLTGSIENIVRREYGGDSHAFTQMLYSVGMAISPDPLSPITIESSQKEIIAEWTKEKLISGLTETIGRIDRDQLQAWFSSSTPDDFGQDFRLKQAEAEQAEKEIMMAAKEGLKQKGLENSLVESVLTIFESTQGIALNVSSPQRKLVSVGVFDKLNQAATLDEVEEAKVLFSKESESDRLRKFAIMDEEDLLKAKPEETRSDEEKKMLDGLFQERRALQLKSLGVGNEFNALRLNAERRIKLDGLLKVQNPGMTRRELDIIVAEKKIFTDKIRAFADDKDIDFNPETGLPSKGVEFQRRAAYASQFFTVTDESIKLNRAGTFVILQHRGVLEKNEGLDVD